MDEHSAEESPQEQNYGVRIPSSDIPVNGAPRLIAARQSQGATPSNHQTHAVNVKEFEPASPDQQFSRTRLVQQRGNVGRPMQDEFTETGRQSTIEPATSTSDKDVVDFTIACPPVLDGYEGLCFAGGCLVEEGNCLEEGRCEGKGDPCLAIKIRIDEGTEVMKVEGRSQGSTQSQVVGHIGQVQPIDIEGTFAATANPGVVLEEPLAATSPDMASFQSDWSWILQALFSKWCSGVNPTAGALPGHPKSTEGAGAPVLDIQSRETLEGAASNDAPRKPSIMFCRDSPLVPQTRVDEGGDQQSCFQVEAVNPCVDKKGGHAAGRLAGLVLSAGQSTLQYLTATVAPATMSLAHKGVNSTMTFLSHIHAVPCFSSLAGSGGEDSSSQPANQSASTSRHGAMKSAAEGSTGIQHPELSIQKGDREIQEQGPKFGLDIISTIGNSVWSMVGTNPVPAAAAYHDKAAHLCIPIATISPVARSQAKSKRNSIQRDRHRPLYTVPSLEQLDPEIRRQLEVKGFVSLDAIKSSKERQWWNPRRYGLPKYICCGEFRKPRPCTLVLLAILTMCIALPIVLRRK
ncbi:hypothetical protein BGX34_005413 [Mortierella sp. NVP85]|nr:hypothetical protein BGX34_005413 [Mortierella sp. NVP85]